MNIKKIEKIIAIYFKDIENYPDPVITWVLEQKDLEAATSVAALSEDKNRKVHNHQRLVGRMKLKELAANLHENIEAIKKGNSFEEIYQSIENASIFGIGDLTKYDVALRIGFFKNILPDKVYLHRGTKQGAKELVGKIKGRYISKSELPEPFKLSELECWHIEDILCRFKGRFK